MVASGFRGSKEPDAVMCSRCSACAGRIVAEEALATMFEGCGREAWSVVFHVDGERTGGTLVMFCKAKCYARSASRMIDGVRDNIGHCALNRLGLNENARAPEGVVAYDAQLHPRGPCERDDLSFKMLCQAGSIDALPGSLGCLPHDASMRSCTYRSTCLQPCAASCAAAATSEKALFAS